MTKLQESFVKRIGWALTAALTLTLPGLAWAQNAIRAIQSSQQAGVDVVRIEFDQALSAVPTGFTVQNPPRIALDLSGVANGLGRFEVGP